MMRPCFNKLSSALRTVFDGIAKPNPCDPPVVEAINVLPKDASEAEMEQLRVQLQERLNEVNQRAYRLIGRSEGICDGQ